MGKVCVHKKGTYRPFSNSSLITQVLSLNLFDALLTLYAIKVGVEELNPIMNFLLNFGPTTFFFTKVLFVTACILGINKILGHSGRRVYILSASVYWLVVAWHILGLALIWRADLA